MKRDQRLLLDVLTIGIPFCAFKILTGMVIVARPWVSAIGWILIVLGAVDGVVNAINFVVVAAGRPRAMGVCLTQIAFQKARPNRPDFEDLGTSLDVMLSFVLVAVMIGFNLLPELPQIGLRVWSICVVLNVLGAGIGRLSSSLASLGGRTGTTGPRESGD